MLYKQTFSFAIIAALATVLIAGGPAYAIASPATQAAVDQAAVNSAVKEYEDAKAKETKLAQQAEDISARLDAALSDEETARAELRRRVVEMYRVGDVDFLAALFTSESFGDLMSRWDLFSRIGEQDSENLNTLRTARTQAQTAAKNLITLQEQQAESVDKLAGRVNAAKSQLASSKAAQQAYEQRIVAAEKASSESAAKRAAARKAAEKNTKPTSKPSNPSTGSGPVESGAWKTALASHYSKTFTGRGASGAKIGPYSMMVAHKTLPFGTLIEFKYKGKTAVASVEDRGPYTGGRVFDLGPGVVRILGFSGVHKVDYRIIFR